MGALVPLLFTACGGSDSCTPRGGEVATIVAIHESFNEHCLAIAAGSASEIRFENRSGYRHNFAVYRRDPGLLEPDIEPPNLLFRSDDVPPSRTVTLSLDAMEAGSYYFRCDFHPTIMEGTLIVGL